MKTFTYWIQHADFTTTAGHPVSTEQAIQAFAEHGWDAEILAAKDMITSGAADVCTPGIGFHPAEDNSDSLLHIQPISWDKANVAYLFPEQRARLFGLLSPTTVIGSAASTEFPIELVAETIRLFMTDRHSDLLSLLGK